MDKVLYNPKANAPALYIPAWLSQIPSNKLTPSCKLVYGRLAQWATSKGKAYRSASQLSHELGIPVRTIENCIKELRDKKLIGSCQNKEGGVNHFEFYDHPWMHEQINENLCYKSDILPPSAKIAEGVDNSAQKIPPSAKIAVPSAKIAVHKIKEIKDKKIKEGTSCEAPDFEYNAHPKKQNPKEDKSLKSDNFTDLTVLPIIHSKNSTQVDDLIEKKIRSDYFENHPQKETQCKNKTHLELNDLLQDNIFELSEQLISDWMQNRKKKRIPITQTSWNQITKKLNELNDMGINPQDAFEKMVASGWQSIEINYFVTKEQLSKHEQAKKRSLELEERAKRQKQKEIESSKNFKAIVSQVGILERNKLRGMLGMSLRG